MSWAILTFSGLDRAEKDPWGYAIDEGPRVQTDDATRGTLIHLFMCRASQLGDADLALEAIREAGADESILELCRSIDVDLIPAGTPEPAYAYDIETRTARSLGSDIERAYGSLGQSEIAGSSDHEAFVDGVLHVYDYKTGFESVPRASESLQLAAQALSTARVHGVREAFGVIVRVTDTGALLFDRHAFTAEDLDEIGERIKSIVDRIATARTWITHGDYPAVNPGEHCRYCPALANCPAYRATSVDIVNGYVQLDINSNNAAVAWNWIERAGALIRRAESMRDKGKNALRAFLDANGEVLLPDGRVLALYPETRESIDGRVALPVLRERLGAKADEAVKVTVAKDAIYDALKSVDPSRGIGKRNDALLAELRDAGAVKSKTTYAIEARKAVGTGG
jgi:hypothetical protein